jgi:hypothetical protein
MQEGMRLRLDLDGCPELTREGLQDTLEGEEVGRPLGHPPARRREWARGQSRDALGLEGGRGALARELATQHAAGLRSSRAR